MRECMSPDQGYSVRERKREIWTVELMPRQIHTEKLCNIYTWMVWLWCIHLVPQKRIVFLTGFLVQVPSNDHLYFDQRLFVVCDLCSSCSECQEGRAWKNCCRAKWGGGIEERMNMKSGNMKSCPDILVCSFTMKQKSCTWFKREKYNNERRLVTKMNRDCFSRKGRERGMKKGRMKVTWFDDDEEEQQHVIKRARSSSQVKN